MRRRKIDNIIIISWNCEGISSKKDELMAIIDRNNPDIVLLQETFLKENKDFRIRNYTTYRKERKNKVGGGVAILIKHDIVHHPLPPILENSKTETIGIELIRKNNERIQINSLYSPPKHKIEAVEWDEIMRRGNKIITAGDFNTKHTEWNCKTTNQKGRDMKKYVENRDVYILSPTEATHRQNGKEDILDMAMIKNITSNVYIEVSDNTTSDHDPIKVTIEGETIRKKKIFTDWKEFKNTLDTTTRIKDIRSDEDLEKEVENLEETIKNAIRDTTREEDIEETRKPIPEHIKDMIDLRKMARKEYQRTLDPRHKNIINQLNNMIRRNLRDHYSGEWERKLEKLSEEEQPPWRIAKALKNEKRTNCMLKINDKYICKDEEKAKIFAENLKEQFKPNDIDDPKFVEEVEQFNRRQTNIPENYKFDEVTTDEIKNIIENLNTKKAPGHDKITNRALKNLPEKTIEKIKNVCNGILTMRRFPNRWKTAETIMIPKPRKTRTEPNNYRPISLLTGLSKIAEKTILERLTIITDELNIIPDEQHGFRKGHGTMTQLARTAEIILREKQRGFKTGALLLDISRAFDKVWHQGLIHKMLKAGIPTALTKLIASYLEGRKFYVKINEEKSELKEINAGVPQGSLLGPILYSIFTSDIPKHEEAKLGLYADDTILMAAGKTVSSAIRRLQEYSNTLMKWFRKWRIKINEEKTQAIMFEYKNKRTKPTDRIKINNTEIPWKDDVTYLGIKFDKFLNFNRHIEEAENKANRIRGYLYPLINRKSKLKKELKVRIYKSIIRPTMTYGSEIIFMNEIRIEKLERIQSKTLREAINAPWYIRNEEIRKITNTPKLRDFIVELAKRTYEKLENHLNEEIKKTMDYDPRERRRIKRPRTRLMEMDK